MTKAVLLVAMLLSTFLCVAQGLTGTWIGCFSKDEPGNRQLYFFRFYLKENKDHVLGIGQTFGAGTRIEELDNTDTKIALTYHLSGSGLQQEGTLSLQAANPYKNGVHTLIHTPLFSGFECTPIKGKVADLIKNSASAMDIPNARDTWADLEMVKVSDSLPVQIQEMILQQDESSDEGIKIKSLLARRRKPQAGTLDPLATPKQRSDEIQATVLVPEDIVELSVYDNGTIDNDTVSVYLNGLLIIDRQKLSQHPIKRMMRLNAASENKLLLFAHNEGSVPPNTALVVLASEKLRKEFNMGSTLVRNGVVVIQVKNK